MTQKGVLSDADRMKLDAAMIENHEAQAQIENYRAVVVEMLGKSSFREVANLTGLSTNTLQRWKREAGK